MTMSSIVPRATFERSAYVVTRPPEYLSSDRWNMAVTTVSPVGRNPMPAGTSGTSHRVSRCPLLSILKTVRARLSTSQRNPSRQRGPSKRSEEHTSELQSLAYLVCRLLLEKKKNKP